MATEISWDVPEDDGIMINANSIEFDYRYSIGELLSFLPSHIGEWYLTIWHDWHFERWVMCFEPEKQTSSATELVDATYNLIIKLKEEGVI